MGTKVEAWQLSPTGAGVGDVLVAVQRAGLFTTQSLSQFGSVTLLVARRDGAQSTYLVTPASAASRKAADLLASSLGATAVKAEVPVDVLTSTPKIRQLMFQPFSGTFRETQQGADPAEQARLLAASMTDGQWLAITLRGPGRFEYRRHSRWLATRMATFLPTHHSLASEAVIGSFYVGAEHPSDADALLRQVASTMPGFDLPVRTGRVVPRTVWSMMWLAAALVLWAGAVLPALASSLVPAGLPWAGALTSTLLVAATLLALPPAVIGYAIGRGAIPTRDTRLRAAARSGLFPAPAHYEVWRGPWTAPTKGGTDNDGRQVKARQGNYPVSHRSFVLGPHLPVLLCAPHAGAVSGQMSTGGRPVPPPLRQRVGPLLGYDPVGNPVYLSAADLVGGTFISGRRGSGKTLLLNGMYAWACLDRVRPCGLPGTFGPNQALVAFESKGEGATKYLEWAHAMGDSATLVEVADPQGWSINLLDVPGTWNDRGLFFADMLKYVLDDGAIGPSSFMGLASFGAAALALTETEAGRTVLAQVDGVGADVALMDLIYILVGGRGDEVAVRLDAEVAGEAARLERLGAPDPGLNCARDALRPYYGGNTPSSRRDAVAPPRNKIFALLAAGHWWSGTRPSLTWDQILTGLRSVVVNTGPSVMRPGEDLPAEVADQMAGMLMFSLQRAIMRNCAAWGEQGYSVAMFADELALLAGSDDRVITWLHDQGRSFGVRSAFATQRSSQLSERVRESVMDYSTLIAFRQSNEGAAAPIVADLAADGSPWSVADMVTLPRYTAAVRTAFDDQRQTPFTFKAHYFAGDVAGFPELQGWTPGAGPEPVPAAAVADANDPEAGW
ncbi:type IV secretory system conjugative DNA transfer family protein [Oerskovia enterophila]|uniref:AAA-like domain protein n=1 Tax=Oerskovia enterophila TaxID=43678 RepID=A0ABX2Y8U4_9CELL|nr:hypothetical protein [Oerskovia enterophila]OCI32915.1 AAA-like domain protein [Oerskovia enterophila]